MSEERVVPTPHGEARLLMRRAREPIANLLLTHGAGGGIESADLTVLAECLPAHGIGTVLLEMPWRRAGGRLAPRPAILDECFRAVLGTLRPRSPLVIGGRSAGARSACRVSAGYPVAGVLALAFPLHPPGRPESSRVDELTSVEVPVLVVQGGNDPFGNPAEFPENTELVVVPDADHGLKVPRRSLITQEEGFAIVRESVLEWVVREVAGNRSP